MKNLEKNLGAFALFVKNNKLQIQQNAGTDVDGNAILKTRSYNLVVDDYDEETLEDMITFASQVATVTDQTVTAVYQNVTKQVEESVGE